jgi:hypothetical protein
MIPASARILSKGTPFDSIFYPARAPRGLRESGKAAKAGTKLLYFRK